MPPSAARSRRFVAETLSAWGYPLDLRELATLLASELVTNAIVHARSDAELVLTRTDRALRVAVRDTSLAPAVVRYHDADAMTGRGLALVADLASTWGIDEHTSGKVVWFELGEDAAR